MRRRTDSHRHGLRFSMDKETNIVEKIVIGIIALILTFLIFSIFSGFAALFKIGSRTMPQGTSPSSGEPVNILMLGMDIGDPSQADNQSIKRTDTIMVVNYNPSTKKIKVVSVPRDTLISNNGKNLKINAAYAVGGYPKIKNEVENLLGIDVNYMVKVDYNAFVEVIDALGGVTMDIDQNMIYDDEGQNLHINFKAGETVKMDGQKAQEFFRWRKNNDGSGLANGDLDRIKNQQKFISKVVDKCKSPFILFRISKVLSAVGDNVETNMHSFKVLKYGISFLTINKDDISMATAEGTPKTINGQSYLVFDKNSNNGLLSSSGSSKSSGVSEAAKANLKIKILNATKINGLAGKLKDEMTGLGYSKIDTGNTDLSDKSMILSNNRDAIKILKGDLSIKNSSKKEDKIEYKDYDAIIILGKDYSKFGE
ncbi:MAG: LCP family protein [Clostridium sp.]|nr:LCP family protein [Clostridium sp.]